MTQSSELLGGKYFFFLWFGAAISIAEMMTGEALAPLGFYKGAMAVIIGHLIGTTILVLGGMIGTRERLSAMETTQMSLGRFGPVISGSLNVLQLIGWTTIMIITGAQSLNDLSIKLWNFNGLLEWKLLIGLFIFLWIFFGRNGFKYINTIAVSLLFLLTIILSFVVFTNHNLLFNTATTKMSFGTGLELSIVMPISWLPLISDYSRLAKNTKSGAYGVWFGYFIGSSWMYLIGLGAGIISNNVDPSMMMAAAHLGIFALGIIILSTVTTTFLDSYSAGVSTVSIIGKGSEGKIALIITVIGTFVALIFPMDKYENFLYAIGSVFAPLFAIVISHYFSKSPQSKDVIVNIGALFIWIVGIKLYYFFVSINFILGATLPDMVLTSLIYILLSRWLSKWTIKKKKSRQTLSM